MSACGTFLSASSELQTSHWPPSLSSPGILRLYYIFPPPVPAHLDSHVVGGTGEFRNSRRRSRGAGPGALSVGVLLSIQSSVDRLLLLHPEAPDWDLGGSDFLEVRLLLGLSCLQLTH